MKNKKLQEILKQYPDDIEVILLDGYTAWLDIQKTTVTTWDKGEKDDFMKSYHSVDSDDYWNFAREEVEVLVIF